MSRACQPRMSISRASGSSCCARSFRVCVDWRSCPTAINPTSMTEIGIVRTAASSLGIEVSASEILGAEDIAPAIATIAKQADALFVVGDPLTFTHRTRINTLALAARLPTSYSTRGYVEAGGLMSYGPNFSALFRRAGDLVDKILHGAKPADIPVEQPTKFDLIINLTTAKALGIAIPNTLMAIADQVIE